MFEGSESEREHQRYPENPENPVGEEASAGEIPAEGGEGRRNADSTPEISVEGEHGQTAVPAPEDDAEKASDEETRFEE
jgi:hypothetical protein